MSKRVVLFPKFSRPTVPQYVWGLNKKGFDFFKISTSLQLCHSDFQIPKIFSPKRAFLRVRKIKFLGVNLRIKKNEKKTNGGTLISKRVVLFPKFSRPTVPQYEGDV